jgi:hypothetical protein
MLAPTRPLNRVVRVVGENSVMTVPLGARSDVVAALIFTEQADRSDDTVVLSVYVSRFCFFIEKPTLFGAELVGVPDGVGEAPGVPPPELLPSLIPPLHSP